MEAKHALKLAEMKEWKARCDKDNWHNKHFVDNFNTLMRAVNDVDRCLIEVADEESKIPLYDEEKP